MEPSPPDFISTPYRRPFFATAVTSLKCRRSSSTRTTAECRCERSPNPLSNVFSPRGGTSIVRSNVTSLPDGGCFRTVTSNVCSRPLVSYTHMFGVLPRRLRVPLSAPPDELYTAPLTTPAPAVFKTVLRSNPGTSLPMQAGTEPPQLNLILVRSHHFERRRTVTGLARRRNGARGSGTGTADWGREPPIGDGNHRSGRDRVVQPKDIFLSL